MSVLWLAEAFTITHTPGDTANHRHFTPSYLICMWISVRQDMLANQNLYTTRKLCPIVGELASSPMEGNKVYDCEWWSKCPFWKHNYINEGGTWKSEAQNTFTHIGSNNENYKYVFYPQTILQWNKLSSSTICAETFMDRLKAIPLPEPFLHQCLYSILILYVTRRFCCELFPL